MFVASRAENGGDHQQDDGSHVSPVWRSWPVAEFPDHVPSSISGASVAFLQTRIPAPDRMGAAPPGLDTTRHHTPQRAAELFEVDGVRSGGIEERVRFRGARGWGR